MSQPPSDKPAHAVSLVARHGFFSRRSATKEMTNPRLICLCMPSLWLRRSPARKRTSTSSTRGGPPATRAWPAFSQAFPGRFASGSEVFLERFSARCHAKLGGSGRERGRERQRDFISAAAEPFLPHAKRLPPAPAGRCTTRAVWPAAPPSTASTPGSTTPPSTPSRAIWAAR